jgi:hypothetical protein
MPPALRAFQRFDSSMSDRRDNNDLVWCRAGEGLYCPGTAPPTALYKATSAVAAEVRPTAS